MKQENQKLEEATGVKPRRNKKKLLVGLALTLLLAIGVGYGGLMMRQKLANANSQLGNVQEQLTAAEQKLVESNKELTAVNEVKNIALEEGQRSKAEIEKLTRSLAELTDTKTVLPSLKIVESKHFNERIIIDGVNDFIMFKAELTNNSRKDTYFSTADLKLKDANDIVHPYFTEASVGGWSGRMGISGASFLPEGYSEIKSQVIKPGETVRGGLIFVGPAALKTVKLLYGESSFALNLLSN